MTEKKMININHHDVEKILLFHKNFQQTIHLVLAEAFCDSDSMFFAQIKYIHH